MCERGDACVHGRACLWACGCAQLCVHTRLRGLGGAHFPSEQVAAQSEAVCAARVSRRVDFPALARIARGYHCRHVAILSRLGCAFSTAWGSRSAALGRDLASEAGQVVGKFIYLVCTDFEDLSSH